MTAFEKSKAACKARQERNKAIRAKYGSLNEWKKKCFFSMETLKARGWNKELVENILGNYDETTSGSYRACELWLKKRVFEAEKLPAVKASMKATLKRSANAKARQNDFEVEANKIADSIKITLPKRLRKKTHWSDGIVKQTLEPIWPQLRQYGNRKALAIAMYLQYKICEMSEEKGGCYFRMKDLRDIMFQAWGLPNGFDETKVK